MSFHSLNNCSQSDIWPDCLLYLLVAERATVSLKTRIIRVSSADSAREQQFRDQNLSSEEWTSRHAWQPPQTDFSVQQKPDLGFSCWNQYWVKQNNAGRPTGRCSNRWGEIKHSPHSTNTADSPDSTWFTWFTRRQQVREVREIKMKWLLVFAFTAAQSAREVGFWQRLFLISNWLVWFLPQVEKT